MDKSSQTSTKTAAFQYCDWHFLGRSEHRRIFDPLFQSSIENKASIDKLEAALLEAKVHMFIISCHLPYG